MIGAKTGTASYGDKETTNPVGPSDGNARVLRGGSWFFPLPWLCRSAYRVRYGPGNRRNDVGLRLCFCLD